MLIVMETTATPDQIKAVEKSVAARGYEARPIPGGDRMSIGVLRNKGAVDASLFIGLAGVKDVIPVTRPYKLVSRETRSEDTVVRIGGVTIGNGHMTIIAGPCAIESEEQARAREQDPRRAERLEKARAVMADIFEGAPTFTDLSVIEEWTGADVAST